MSDETVKRRRYDNSARAEQARATRHRVVAAAYRLLVEQGYAATTIKAVATEAGVSPETIYKTFGSKAALIKDVYDTTLVGDEEPVPFADRPEYRALAAEPTARGKLAHYATLCRVLADRLGPLLAVLLSGARTGDPDLQAFGRTIKRERLAGAEMMVRQLVELDSLRPGLSPDHARDLIWTLNSPEVHQLLVGERGWGADAYEAWLATAFAAALLETS